MPGQPPSATPRRGDPSPFDRVKATALNAHCIAHLAERLESTAPARSSGPSPRVSSAALTSYPALIEAKPSPREQRWVSQLPLAETGRRDRAGEHDRARGRHVRAADVTAHHDHDDLAQRPDGAKGACCCSGGNRSTTGQIAGRRGMDVVVVLTVLDCAFDAGNFVDH